MSLYQDERAIIANAEKIAGQAAKRKSRKVWTLAGVGTLFAGGAAFAAVQLFGYGTLDAEAATLKNLDVSGVQLSGSLVPGASVGGKGYVGNGNDFDVKVTAIIVQDNSVQLKGAGCDPKTLTFGGVAVASYPGQGGGPGHRIALAAPVTIQAGKTVEVKANNVVSQDASANALCGVKVNFAVEAQVGS